MTPRVSVVVPTRNRRRLLARALASVDAQRYRDFEVVVVDDASADDTVQWLRAQRPHDRLVENDRPGGAATSRNQAIALARGEVVAFLDDDDAWHPEYLETQVRQLDANREAEMGTTGLVEVDPEGRRSQPDLRPSFDYVDGRARMLAECPVYTMSLVACRRSAFARIGMLDETLTIVHDLDWYVRLLAAGGRVTHDPRPLVERAMPGGLVTQYRRWFFEERTVYERAVAMGAIEPDEQRRIRAARALLFARLAFAHGDVPFGAARLLGALAASPTTTARLGLERLRRRTYSSAGRARRAGAEANR